MVRGILATHYPEAVEWKQLLTVGEKMHRETR